MEGCCQEESLVSALTNIAKLLSVCRWLTEQVCYLTVIFIVLYPKEILINPWVKYTCSFDAARLQSVQCDCFLTIIKSRFNMQVHDDNDMGTPLTRIKAALSSSLTQLIFPCLHKTLCLVAAVFWKCGQKGRASERAWLRHNQSLFFIGYVWVRPSQEANTQQRL